MKTILNKINFDKYNIVMIAPEEEFLIKYYEKFGFVKFNYKKKMPIENLFKKDFDIKIGNINDSQEITKLFNDYTNKYKIAQYRDIYFTKERLKEVFIDDGKLFILSINNINYGYFIYEQGKITEHINLLENEKNENYENIAKTLENKKINYILECKNIDEELSINENNYPDSNFRKAYSLIRLINPHNFVKKYLDFIFNDKNENEFNKNVIVKDEIIGDSYFNVKKIKNKKFFSINKDDDAINIEITISELMKTIFRKIEKNFDNKYHIQDKFFFIEKW